MEVVGARLGHHVDVGALEVVVEHRVRSQVHAHRLDGVGRDRAALGRIAVGVQAEVVVLLHAVDGQRVEAAGHAPGDHRVEVRRVKADERVKARNVLQVALEAGQFLDVGQREARGRAAVVLTVGRGGRDDQFLDRGLEGDVDGDGLADADLRHGLRLGLAANGRLDGVGAADAQAARIVEAVAAGHGTDRRAGRHVDDGDRGVRRRLAIGSDHLAADARGGFLSVGGGSQTGQQRTESRPIGKLLHRRHLKVSPLASTYARRRPKQPPRALIAPIAPKIGPEVTLLRQLAQDSPGVAKRRRLSRRRRPS